MTFLPILQRELRVRARSSANYWARFAVAGVGVLVCVPPLMWSGPFMPAASIGRGAFNGLVGAAFLLCCAACLITADTISCERREGTLGLLLLTSVSQFDVLLGKFGASGLACLGGLMAFVPVLALPLLSGGVTGGEALRKALALSNSLFLALSVGLWASARGYERFRTIRLSLLAVGTLALGPALLGLLLPETHAEVAGPLGALLHGADLAYRKSPIQYWLSLSLVQMVGWAFLLGASCWMEKVSISAVPADNASQQGLIARIKAPATLSVQTATPPQNPDLCASLVKCPYCGRQNKPDALLCFECGTSLRINQQPTARPTFNLSAAPTPLHWLLRRQRGLKPMLWLAAFIGFFHFTLFGTFTRFFGPGLNVWFFGMSGALGLTLTVLTGSIFSWVASRFFVEARRSGELELLLTTPLGAEQLVSTQWDILKSQARWPIVMILVPVIFQGLFWVSLGYGMPEFWKLYYFLSLAMTAGNIIFSIGALCWLSLALGFRAGSQGRVILWTVLAVNGLPYALSLVWSVLYRPVIIFIGGVGSSSVASPWLLGFLIPQLAAFLLYLWLIRFSRALLLNRLTQTEPLNPQETLAGMLLKLRDALGKARRWPSG